MEAIPSGVCQAAEGGKESEDGRGGCVVGGLLDRQWGRTMVARQSERRGYGDESEGE